MESSASPNNDALGSYALRYIKPGQTIGLGTGRAATAFIRALGAKNPGIRGIPTSNATEALARSLAIEIADLAQIRRIDIDIDGADEVDPRLNLIKGLGGALVREKIVAAAARRRIFLVGEEKLVRRLGAHGNLPLEVVPFALPYVIRELSRLGLRAAPRHNPDGSPLLSDNHNYVVDCRVREIGNPARLERELRAIPGVVGSGIFVQMAELVVVAMRDGSLKTLRRRGIAPR